MPETENKRSLALRVIVLVASIVINAFSVSVYVKSDLGTSTNSAVPLVMSAMIPGLSLGIASIVFQALLLIVLLFICGKKRDYAVSFALGCLFGFVVDGWNELWRVVPIGNLPPVALFFIAFFSLAFGIAMAIVTGLPTLPFDYFVKDLSVKFGKTVGFVKTSSDVSYVVVAFILSYAGLGRIYGIGIGTVFAMFCTGFVVHFFLKRIRWIC